MSSTFRLAPIVLIALGVTLPERASAFIGAAVNYVKQYQVGIDYTSQSDQLHVTYDTDTSAGVPETCTAAPGDASKMTCKFYMPAGGASGFGIFLQRAFKKQGFWYFDYDLSFGARYLNGEWEDPDRVKESTRLKNAKFSLATVIAKPYIQFGITPDRWPDILLSIGPAAQIAVGTMTINDKTERVAAGTSSYSGPMSLLHGFFELEIVLKRFGDGAFSVFSSHDVTGSGEGTKIYPKGVDEMSNFRGTFSHNVGGMAFGLGLKLVTPWP